MSTITTRSEASSLGSSVWNCLVRSCCCFNSKPQETTIKVSQLTSLIASHVFQLQQSVNSDSQKVRELEQKIKNDKRTIEELTRLLHSSLPEQLQNPIVKQLQDSKQDSKKEKNVQTNLPLGNRQRGYSAEGSDSFARSSLSPPSFYSDDSGDESSFSLSPTNQGKRGENERVLYRGRGADPVATTTNEQAKELKMAVETIETQFLGQQYLDGNIQDARWNTPGHRERIMMSLLERYTPKAKELILDSLDPTIQAQLPLIFNRGHR